MYAEFIQYLRYIQYLLYISHHEITNFDSFSSKFHTHKIKQEKKRHTKERKQLRQNKHK